MAPEVGAAEAAVLCHAGWYPALADCRVVQAEPEESENCRHWKGDPLLARRQSASDRFRVGEMVSQSLMGITYERRV